MPREGRQREKPQETLVILQVGVPRMAGLQRDTGRLQDSVPRAFATCAAQVVPEASQGLRQRMELVGKEAMSSSGNRGKTQRARGCAELVVRMRL